MQNVNLTISHLTGNGWKDTKVSFRCDENIGLNAGKDIYATARGTSIKLARQLFFTSGTRMHLSIDNDVHIIMFKDTDGTIKKSTAAKIGDAVKWPWEE